MHALTRTLVIAMAATLVTGALTVAAPAAGAKPIWVDTGGEFTCAVTTKGAVKCWGENDDGQVGNGKLGNKVKPTQVKGLKKDAWFVAAGEDHACAIQGKGAVKCWGYNFYGQIGDGSDQNERTSPKKVKKMNSGAVLLAAGRSHTCAIKGKKLALFCWGANFDGQLGDGTDEQRLTPTKVKGMGSGVVDVVAGADHTCAIKGKELTLFCWGYNFFGQVGDGTDGNERLTPTKVQDMAKGVVEIAAGDYHTCAIKGKKLEMSCWGNNIHGQLGDGTDEKRLTPTKVQDMSKGVVTIGAGGYHTCAIKGKKRTLFCWGWNVDGQLGDGTTDTPRTTPGKVKKMGKSIQMVDGGAYHTCAIKGKALSCWGYNGAGQLGDGSTDPRYTPKKVKV